MADAKVTALSAIGAVALEDLLYVVDDPSGTATSKKATVQQLADLIGGGGATMAPFVAPVDGDFSWVNQGGASVSTADGGIYLEAPTSGSENLRLRVKSQPSTPYTVTIAFMPYSLNVDHIAVGLHLRESGTGKVRSFVHSHNANLLYRIYGYTDATTYGFSNIADNNSGRQVLAPVQWLRVTNDGTYLNFYYSIDGFHWRLSRTETVTTWFTTAPDQVAFGVNALNGGINIGMWLLSWSET